MTPKVCVSCLGWYEAAGVPLSTIWEESSNPADRKRMLGFSVTYTCLVIAHRQLESHQRWAVNKRLGRVASRRSAPLICSRLASSSLSPSPRSSSSVLSQLSAPKNKHQSPHEGPDTLRRNMRTLEKSKRSWQIDEMAQLCQGRALSKIHLIYGDL